MSVIIFTLTNTLLMYINICKTLGLSLNLVAILKSKFEIFSFQTFKLCLDDISYQLIDRLISSD